MAVYEVRATSPIWEEELIEYCGTWKKANRRKEFYQKNGCDCTIRKSKKY